MLHGKATQVIMTMFILAIPLAALGQGLIWNPLADMPTPHMSGRAVVCQNKIYRIGGVVRKQGDAQTENNWQFDPMTHAWTKKADMRTGRAGLAVAVVNDQIYALGGGPVFLDKNERYDPATDTWAELSPMPTGRQHLDGTVIDGKIYVIGGLESWERVSNQNEVYDPATDTWSQKAPLPTARHNSVVIAWDNRVYVIGGCKQVGGNIWKQTALVEVYSPQTDTWTTKSNLPFLCESPQATILDERLYLMGGWMGQHTIVRVLGYEFEADHWTEIQDSLPQVTSSASVVTYDYRILMMGGCADDWNPYTNVFQGQLSCVTDPNGFIENVSSGQRFSSIQCAIDYAGSHEVVVLEPGIYEESLVLDKDITLQSMDPNDPLSIGGTIIQGDPNEPVVTLANTTTACTLAGLTLRAGSIGLCGTGINATLHNCRIMDNTECGIHLSQESNPYLNHCLITANSQTGITMVPTTGGRSIRHCQPVIEDCVIVDNNEASLVGGEPVIINSILQD